VEDVRTELFGVSSRRSGQQLCVRANRVALVEDAGSGTTVPPIALPLLVSAMYSLPCLEKGISCSPPRH